MTFATHIHFPQSQGGPNPVAVRRGCKHLFDTLKDALPFETMQVDDTNSALTHDIQHYDALLSNLKHATAWLKKNNPRTIFTLGGDCSIDVGNIDHLHSVYGKHFGLIWIDAHADIHVPAGSDSKYFHGMPLRTLLGEGDAGMLAALKAPLSRQQICYAGIESIDAPEQAYIDQHNLPVVTAADVNAGDYSAFTNWRKQNDIKHLHIHFDLDALDPQDNIAVTYPVGRIRLSAMKDFLRFLHGQGITVGFTITEYAPEDETKNPAAIAEILELIRTIVPLPETV